MYVGRSPFSDCQGQKREENLVSTWIVVVIPLSLGRSSLHCAGIHRAFMPHRIVEEMEMSEREQQQP